MSAAGRKKLLGDDEVGGQEKVESIVQGLNVTGRRLVYSNLPSY
jgi:hypothetical protein